jgi:hypothetical protein
VSNVTPIRGSDGAGQPPSDASPKRQRPRKERPGVVLVRSGEYEGFTTHDVLVGLDGVCCALDAMEWSVNMDIDTAQRLSIASKVLVSILCNREITP